MPKLSVIVPVYNVEKYLPKCLESLVGQSERDMEIILVNDGSTDNSPSICERFAERDNRIKIISKENGGVNSARNLGFKEAKGKYIFFMDSDDYVEKNMLSNFDFENDDMDIFLFGFSLECKNKSIEDTFPKSANGIYINKDIEDKVMPYFLIYGSDLNYNLQSLSAWRMIFSHNFLKKINLSFSKTIKSLDDSLFAITALRYAKKLTLSDKVYYHYLKRRGSLMFSRNPKFNEDYLEVFKIIKNFEFKIDERYADNPNFYYSNIFAMIKNSSYKNFWQARRELKQLLSDKFINSFLEKISAKKISNKKILFYLVKYKLYIPIIVLYRIRTKLEQREFNIP